MTPQMPASGPEREIFLRALRLFSDACRPPDLLRECPYSVDLPEGGRGCAEECIEILDRYGEPEQLSPIEFGHGIAAVPLKSNREATPSPVSNRPFDAAEIRLRDKAIPDLSKWSTSTLVIELRENFIPSPQALTVPARGDLCRRICAEIDLRGLSSNDLIRYGLGSSLVHTIPIAVTAPALMAVDQRFAERNGFRQGTPLPEAPPGWVQLADLIAADTNATGLAPLTGSPTPRAQARRRMNAALTSAFTNKLHGWVETADLQALIDWEAPAVSDFLDFSLPESTKARKMAFVRSRWLMDRLTETYLSDWRFTSLQLEWRYSRGEQEPPCGRKVMRERYIERNELAFALSDAASRRDSTNEKSAALYSMALQLVKSEQVASAAEVLKLALKGDPENPKLLNSLGFCMLAEEPQVAIEYLEQARSLGYKNTVNTCNLLYGLLRTGKYAAVLELSEAALVDWPKLDRTTSVLWDFKSEEPKILRNACSRCYVKDIGLYVVRSHGDASSRLRWDEMTRNMHDPSVQ